MPTFYQTLSGVTHLDEQEIIDLEKKYWQLKSQSTNGKFDLQLFLSFTSSLFTVATTSENSKFSIAHGLFTAFDENCDGHLDFKEMVCGISAACRGPLVERIKCKCRVWIRRLLVGRERELIYELIDDFTVCFKIFDHDGDGVLNGGEVSQLMGCLKDLETEQNVDTVDGATISFEMLDSVGDESVHLELFLIWAVQQNSLKHLLDLLHQVTGRN